MGYRIIADEHVEPATMNYLRKLGHDVEWVGEVEALGFSATDEEIAAYAREADRLVLTRDDDFITALADEEGPGVLFQTDGTLSGREVGDVVHEMSEYIAQERIDLEYVSRNWL